MKLASVIAPRVQPSTKKEKNPSRRERTKRAGYPEMEAQKKTENEDAC
jgi:hypothetical protein